MAAYGGCRWEWTVAMTPIPKRVVRELGLLTDQAIEVVEVLPRGPAAAAGLQAGDWIVSAGGRITAGAGRSCIRRAWPGSKPSVTSSCKSSAASDC
jgi:C-terminal processing protease CtpA/Prc